MRPTSTTPSPATRARRRGRVTAVVAVAAASMVVAACATTVTGASQRPDGWSAPPTTETTAPTSPDAPPSSSAGPTDSLAPGQSDTDSPASAPTRGAIPTIADDPGNDVPDSAVGLRPDAPTPNLPIDDFTGSDADLIAAHTLADVFDYYDTVFPEVFGRFYEEPRELISYDSTIPGGSICTISTYNYVNAFYVSTCDTVAWDRGVMLPTMMKDIGVIAPAVVLAHEIGHDVQNELGQFHSNPTIVLEQQADCYAGAYWRWVADGNSKHFYFNQTEGIRQMLLALFSGQDPVQIGGNPEDVADHGNGFDRTYAAVLGYTTGALRCSEIDRAEIAARSQQFPFTGDPSTYGNLDITAEILSGLMATVDEYFTQTSPGYVPPTLETFDGPTSPACTGYESTFPVAYCPTTNTVSYNLPELQKIGTPTEGWSSANGDFSAIVLLVSRYAMAAQVAGHSEITGKDAGLRALCYAGTWATWMRDPHGGYSLSPTDVDKAIYEIVSADYAGTDVNGETDASIIERVQAFDIGVTHQIPACFDFYPQ